MPLIKLKDMLQHYAVHLSDTNLWLVLPGSLSLSLTTTLQLLSVNFTAVYFQVCLNKI